MAVIGPRFVNGINVDALHDAGVNWGKQIREDYENDRKKMNDGMLALGQGIRDARQHFEYQDYLDKRKANKQSKLDERAEIEALLKAAENSPSAPTKTSTELNPVEPYSMSPSDLEEEYYARMLLYPSSINKYKLNIGRRAGF